MSREWYLFPFFGDSLTYLLTDLTSLPQTNNLLLENLILFIKTLRRLLSLVQGSNKKKNFVGLLPTEERMWKAKYIAEYLRYRGKIFPIIHLQKQKYA